MTIKFDEEDAQAVLEYLGIGKVIEKEKESEYKNGFEDGLRFAKNIIQSYDGNITSASVTSEYERYAKL